ncbi:hypothetical protein HS088_TW12G00771 [Tripterygium wilfordii]|uniref:adenylate kinase n=1 Tax=Tripterygium wilfordii TaxID=458696 RepID=A0A7J7CZQ6_TRIWF|nr:probable adenylate kinase 7, mitochondrial [Tripterygium wilfordii]KAF5739563.1 hypothetical protein HS088_TW12G00771 [Tripterygium wilfordii]
MAGMSRLGAAVASPIRIIRSGIELLSTRRCYGSALAVQYDYCDEEEDHDNVWERKPWPESSVGSESGRGVQWVMIGEPGAKKHVYADRLSKLLEVPHISMGSLVRKELNRRSSLYKKIAHALNEGKLVPEDVIFELLTKRLEEGYCKGETGFILEGIPRTRIQAEIVHQITDIDLVVNFKWKTSALSENFSPCQELFGIGNTECTTSNLANAWKEKIRIYAEQAKPLEDYYRKQKKLLDFQVAGAPGETWQGLLAALHLQHMNAVPS